MADWMLWTRDFAWRTTPVILRNRKEGDPFLTEQERRTQAAPPVKIAPEHEDRNIVDLVFLYPAPKEETR